ECHDGQYPPARTFHLPFVGHIVRAPAGQSASPHQWPVPLLGAMITFLMHRSPREDSLRNPGARQRVPAGRGRLQGARTDTILSSLTRRQSVHRRRSIERGSILPGEQMWYIRSMSTSRPFLNTPYGAYLARDVPAPDDELVRVGPGTPCGEYLRRFWQ